MLNQSHKASNADAHRILLLLPSPKTLVLAKVDQLLFGETDLFTLLQLSNQIVVRIVMMRIINSLQSHTVESVIQARPEVFRGQIIDVHANRLHGAHESLVFRKVKVFGPMLSNFLHPRIVGEQLSQPNFAARTAN